jgi:PKD repeat protein
MASGSPAAGTWLFTQGQWKNITTLVGGLSASPPTTYGAMAWDPGLLALVYVGGCRDVRCSSVYGDEWTLGLGGGWERAAAFGAIYSESIAFDASDQALLAFGGVNAAGTVLNVTWSLTPGGTWSNVTASSVGCFLECNLYPPARSGAAMTWDAAANSVVLFGGLSGSSRPLNDTWTYSGSRWAPFPVYSPFVPPAEAYGAMPANSTAGAPVLLGGEGDGAGDTYVLEAPPAPAISAAMPDPADVGANVTVTVSLPAGSGSGPWFWVTLTSGLQSFSARVLDVGDPSGWELPLSPLRYGAAGTFEVMAEVTDYFGLEQSADGNISVVAQPTVSVQAVPGESETGEGVTFTADPRGGVPPYQWNWSFGDGTYSEMAAPGHAFAVPGIFVVLLRLRDAGGGVALGTVPVTILQGLAAQASANVTSTDVGLPVRFSGSVSGGLEPYSPLQWDFGDRAMATSSSPSFAFGVPGTYDVVLSATDALGYSASARLTLRVNPALSATSLVAAPPFDSGGLTVTLGVNTSGGTYPLAFAWNFGDGSVGTGGSPTHTYRLPGL